MLYFLKGALKPPETSATPASFSVNPVENKFISSSLLQIIFHLKFLSSSANPAMLFFFDHTSVQLYLT
jgi:hypothetical protein